MSDSTPPQIHTKRHFLKQNWKQIWGYLRAVEFRTMTNAIIANRLTLAFSMLTVLTVRLDTGTVGKLRLKYKEIAGTEKLLVTR